MAHKQLIYAKPIFHLPVHSKLVHVALVPHEQAIGRRTAAAAALAAALRVKEALLSSSNIASAFDFSLTAPDQTLEEADSGIRSHARDLLQIKRFIDGESWREAQLALRESSSYLKQDLYTIIQAKPGSQRAQLRKLYSVLFNNASMVSSYTLVLAPLPSNYNDSSPAA